MKKQCYIGQNHSKTNVSKAKTMVKPRFWLLKHWFYNGLGAWKLRSQEVLHWFWGSEAANQWFYNGLGRPRMGGNKGVAGCWRRLTESDFRRLEVARVPLGYISTKYYRPGRRALGFLRLTESAFRRLEVVQVPLGYI